MVGAIPVRRLALLSAACVLALWSSIPGAAQSSSLEGAIASMAEQRAAGRLEEAVSLARTVASRRRAGEAMTEATAARYRQEIDALAPLAEGRVGRVESDLRALLDKLRALAPASDRGARLREVQEAERRAAAAPPALPRDVSDSVYHLEHDLPRIVQALDAQPLTAFATGDRISRLRQAIETSERASDSACAAPDVASAKRAVDSAAAAERELSAAMDAVRAWRDEVPQLLAGRASPEGSPRNRAAALLPRLRELRQAADARERDLRAAVERGETAGRLLPTSRNHLEEVRKHQQSLDRAWSDLAFLEEQQGKPRRRGAGAEALTTADAIVHNLQETAIVTVRIERALLDVVASKGEIDRAVRSLDAQEADIAKRLGQADALEFMSAPGLETASRNHKRARACHTQRILQQAPAPPSTPAAATPGTPPSPPAAQPPARRTPPSAPATPPTARTPADPAPPRPAGPARTPPAADRASPSGQAPAERPDDNVAGGIQIVAPASPARVTVGGRLALRATDRGRHPLSGVQWTSLDTSRLAIDGDGVVTGVARGRATVMARAADGGWTTIEVQVVEGAAADWGLDGGPVREGRPADVTPRPTDRASPAAGDTATPPARRAEQAGWGLDERPATSGAAGDVPPPAQPSVSGDPNAAGEPAGAGIELLGEQMPSPSGATPGGGGAGGAGRAGGAPRPNATALDASRAGPYHEFAAVCRVGWAWGLAANSVGPADNSIAGHLRAAGDHMMMANRSTFAPLQAWPDWSGRRTRFNQMADRLLQSPGTRYREQLAFDLNLGWSGMADDLAVQMAGERQHRENCDSHYARLGYLLCSGQQLLQIAEGESREGDRTRASRLAQDGRQNLVSARRQLDGLRTVRLASGSCVNLSAAAGPLDAAVTTRQPADAVAAANRAFEAVITTLSGVPMATPPPPRHEILGEWHYSMFLDQKDLDHPEELCRINFAEEGGWIVGRLVPGSCAPKKAESLLIRPTPAGGAELFRVRRVAPGRYEGQAPVWNGVGRARLEISGDRAHIYRSDATSTDHRRLFRK